MAPRLSRNGRNAVIGSLSVLLIFVFVGIQVNHERPEKKAAPSVARWTTALSDAEPEPAAPGCADGSRLADESTSIKATGGVETVVMGPNELTAGLSRLAGGLKAWRQRARVNHTEPEATVVAQVQRFTADAKTHARLAAARFSLDVQMAALQAARAGPGARAPPPQLPPTQEADLGYPEPSTFACRMLPDGFEVRGRARRGGNGADRSVYSCPSAGVRVRERVPRRAEPSARGGARIRVAGACGAAWCGARLYLPPPPSP